MKLFKGKKRMLAAGLAAALAAGAGGAAFAYFTTSGSGSGNASVGTSTALVINQDSLTYSNGANLLPGTSATATFTADNPSTGHQLLDTISVTSITSDKALCNTTDNPSWFDISDTNVVNADYAPGNGQAVTGDLTVTFVNDTLASQDACKGAALTINYASN
jgi:hypothetical protein